MLDLREAGFAFPDKKRPVRLLVGYQVGGSRSWLDGDRTVLAGDQYLGMSNHESAWKDGELHLQTHFVLDGDRLEKGEGPLTIYDVVVLWTKVNQE